MIELRDPDRAVELCQKSVDLWPEEAGTWDTLGAAYYRAQKWDKSLAALEKSRELLAGVSSPDHIGFVYIWLHLAATNWELGDRDVSQGWYDKAVALMKKKNSKDKDLIRLHAEVADLIGIDKERRASDAG